jgi:carbamoyl-phosphate synthase large subunit
VDWKLALMDWMKKPITWNHSNELANPGPERIWYIADAFRCHLSIDEVHALTHIDIWFLAHIEDLITQEQAFIGTKAGNTR